MVIVAIKGGLGNQMFQYSFGKQIAALNKTDLLLDLSWFDNMGTDTPRTFNLKSFNIEAQIATTDQIRKLKGPDDRFSRLIRKFSRRYLPFYTASYIPERSPFFDESILKLRGDHYFDGYWNNYRYFNDVSEMISSHFTLRDEFYSQRQDLFNEVKSTNSVSVHIRRGDYANRASTKAFHGLLPLSYYESSIRKIAENIDQPHFYLFSDDIDWVKENLHIPYPHHFVHPSEDGLEAVDLKLMAACKHNIISNSTFSWWAAWLNDNPSKIVIAPPHWSKLVPDTASIIPSTWKINHYV